MRLGTDRSVNGWIAAGVGLLAIAAAAGCSEDTGQAADAMAGGEPDGGGVPPDAAMVLPGGAAGDAGGDLGGQCPPPPAFDFKCDPKDPKTCPKGICVVGQCIGGQVTPQQWADCGNGTCDRCEDKTSCPADCAPPPMMSGQKKYDDPDTITVWLHGFTNHTADSLKNTVYGAVVGCGDVGDAVKTFKVGIPCGADPKFDGAPNQAVGLEYYGAIPPKWMSQKDIAEVEQYPYVGGASGLQRYGLVAAKFIKWRMALTGATHVNLACHSMGCLISRYLIENDLEQLASQNKIVRWVTSAGVVAGAQLAQLYNNPVIQMTADQIGLAVDDFAIMEPDYVQTYAAPYDHKLWDGNNPLWGGVLIHHVGATDPRIAQALNIQLLNLNNPQQNPNDGIMYTFDEMFRAQSPAASVKTPSGAVVSATHTFNYVGHVDAPAGNDFKAQLVAGLFHRRKVFITLDSITLKKDHEFTIATPLEVGLPPAEVVAETEVRYDPYTVPTYGVGALVDNDKLAYWSAPLLAQTAGTTLMPKQPIFEAPIFDDQKVLHLKLVLTEADYYARYNCLESAAGLTDKKLLTFDADVQLMDQTLSASDDGADVKLGVKVIDLY